jgi:hypothetical protein
MIAGPNEATVRHHDHHQSSLRISRQTPYATRAHIIKPIIDKIMAHLATLASSCIRRLSNGKNVFIINTGGSMLSPCRQYHAGVFTFQKQNN